MDKQIVVRTVERQRPSVMKKQIVGKTLYQSRRVQIVSTTIKRITTKSSAPLRKKRVQQVQLEQRTQ